MKQKYKFLAIIIAALLLISALPLAAFADETDPVDQVEENEAVEETTESQEEPDENDYYKFTLPEGDENTHYEQISRSVVKVTVYPNVTEADNEMITPPLEGYIDFTDPSGEASPMVVPPGNYETILDGGGSITYPNDTYISSSDPTTNYGSATEAAVGSSSYLYISYPMPFMPEYANIIEATLNVKYRFRASQPTTIYAHKVTMEWDDDTLTWSSAAQHTGMGLVQTAISSVSINDTNGTSLTTPQNVSINILSAARDWHRGEPNYGIALKGSTKTILVKTSEALTAYRPYFEYYYEIPMTVESGTYYIHNIGNEQYIDIENGSTSYGAIIETNSFSTEDSQKWVLTRLDDGYYTIKSVHSNKYIGVDMYGSLAVKQYSSIEDNTKWAIVATSSGNYKLKCKYFEYQNLALVATTSVFDEGGNLAMAEDVNNPSIYTYNFEWNLGIYVTFEDITLGLGDTKRPNMQANCPEGYISSTDFIYEISEGSDVISINNSTGDITPLKPGTATVRVTHNQYHIQYKFNVRVNKNAIIIVPGIMGSELFVGDYNPYFAENTGIFDNETLNILKSISDKPFNNNTWGNVSSFLNGKVKDSSIIEQAVIYSNAVYDSLRCDEQGNTVYDIKVKKFKRILEDGDSINEYTTQCGTFDLYRPLYEALVSNNSVTAKYDVEIFFYDWRLSNSYSAQKLDEFINELNCGKVILIAHSMGGLVASGYLSMGEAQRDSVIDVYMLASPLLGAPEMLNVWYNLDTEAVYNDLNKIILNAFNLIFSQISGVDDPLRQLLSNYVSVYELLPTERYYDVSPQAYLSFAIVQNDGLVEGAQVIESNNYSFARTLLETYLPYFDPELMDLAEEFHDNCYQNNSHVTQLVDTKYIYAINTQKKTLIKMKMCQVHYEIELLGLTTYELRKEIEDFLGDSTVPMWSATLGLTLNNSNVKEVLGDHFAPVRGKEFNDNDSPNNGAHQYIISQILSN